MKQELNLPAFKRTTFETLTASFGYRLLPIGYRSNDTYMRYHL